MPWRDFAATASAVVLTREPFGGVMVPRIRRSDPVASWSPASYPRGRRQKAENEAAEWQAMEALILVATLGDDARAHRRHAGAEPERRTKI
jgi:hypothetical protein